MLFTLSPNSQHLRFEDRISFLFTTLVYPNHPRMSKQAAQQRKSNFHSKSDAPPLSGTFVMMYSQFDGNVVLAKLLSACANLIHRTKGKPVPGQPEFVYYEFEWRLNTHPHRALVRSPPQQEPLYETGNIPPFEYGDMPVFAR